MQHDRDRIYVDGAWTASTGDGTIDVFDSTDGSVLGRIPHGTVDDVDRAARAAAAAFPAWAQLSPADRAKFCSAIADGLEARADEIATLVSREAGMPKKMSLAIQAALPVNSFRSAAGVAENYDPGGETRVLLAKRLA